VTLALVVDDDDRNRKLACDVLSAAGFHTLGATTGIDAIAVATEHGPDVILMDLQLPDMGGVEVARRLLNDERTSAIPLVAFSAMQLEGSDDWLEAIGFTGWIEKPIEVRAFPDQVRRHCSEATR
jgi:two-component system, cell cycle response regulator DivK